MANTRLQYQVRAESIWIGNHPNRCEFVCLIACNERAYFNVFLLHAKVSIAMPIFFVNWCSFQNHSIDIFVPETNWFISDFFVIWILSQNECMLSKLTWIITARVSEYDSMTICQHASYTDLEPECANPLLCINNVNEHLCVCSLCITWRFFPFAKHACHTMLMAILWT